MQPIRSFALCLIFIGNDRHYLYIILCGITEVLTYMLYIGHRAIIYWHCLYAALVGQYRAGFREVQNEHLPRGPPSK